MNSVVPQLGISIKPTIGVGDALQFSSVPENYFRATGSRLMDISKPWFFDHNPFVIRSTGNVEVLPKKVIEMWNFSPKQFDWPKLRPQGVYLSNAEIYAAAIGVKEVKLNRPRLYQFETFPFHHREKILVQTVGVSHGEMPRHIVDHIIAKYAATRRLYHIGPGEMWGVPQLVTPTLWDLALEISKAQMLICLDSGPAWIAACYPDVIVKKVRTKPSIDVLKTWVPLSVDNIHSHWDDRCHQIFNTTEEDVGFTSAYKKI